LISKGWPCSREHALISEAQLLAGEAQIDPITQEAPVDEDLQRALVRLMKLARITEVYAGA
jgi:hypothetical protein